MSVSPVLPPRTVVKRSGAIAPFDGDKICSAIERAGKATGAFDADEAKLLAIQTLKVLAHRFHDRAPHIEQIQDVVEQALISANHFATARAYIVYREQRARLRSDRPHAGRCGVFDQRVPRPGGLARERQCQSGLLAGRS